MPAFFRKQDDMTLDFVSRARREAGGGMGPAIQVYT